MKICIPPKGPGLNAKVDDRHRRAPISSFITLRVRKLKSIQNPVPGGQSGVGPEAAQILLNNGIEVFVIPSHRGKCTPSTEDSRH
jgi:predicted Fe-Mo cluster-binding NifX family protein